MSLTFEDDQISVLYWALEKLDAEIGLNKDEQPIFRTVADHIGEPHGLDEGSNQ